MRDLVQKILDFRDKRNWKQYHNPKDLAISLSIEAGELLENFQWRSNEEAIHECLENIREEIADVGTYLLLLANELGIDFEKAILDKLEKNKEKYPVEKAYGSRLKYTEYDYQCQIQKKKLASPQEKTRGEDFSR